MNGTTATQVKNQSLTNKDQIRPFRVSFPDEAPRSWAEKAYPKLIHHNKVEKGGHFAAWEQPLLFTAELRAAFRPVR